MPIGWRRVARTSGPEDEIIERYRSVVEPYAGRIRFAVAAFFAIVMGSGVSAEWRDWILFSHATNFGIKDPQFHHDIGFYVFRLPFLQFLAGWTFAALLVILIVTAVFHYLNGGIRLQTPFQRVTPQVKVHISVILALMALTKTVQYYLARFGLTLSHRGVVDGATYTDVNAQLPALESPHVHLAWPPRSCSSLNIFRRGWVFPIIAVGLWGFISIVVGTIYPAVIQRFVVQPNEYAREQTYIKRNIDSDPIRVRPRQDRREAVPLQDAISPPPRSTQPANQADARQRPALGSGPAAARYLRPRRSSSRSIRSPTSTSTATTSTSTGTQTLSGVRELDPTQLPSNTWTNRHLVYTHGYGVDTAAGQLAQRRLPRATCSPTSRPQGSLPLDPARRVLRRGLQQLRGRRHQGRRAGGQRREQRQDHAVQGRRRSEGRRASRAGSRSRCGSATSTSCTRASSRRFVAHLYLRDIQERVQTAAPFLQWDADPYPVEPQRPDRVGARRLHHDQPLPVLAVDPPGGAAPGAVSTPTSTTCATR